MYALPFQKNILVKGWQMSGQLTAQSGSPWNVTVGFDQAGDVVAGSERPNLVMPANQIMQNQWVNPVGFSLPAPGTFGNLQRDFLAGPGILDFAQAPRVLQLGHRVALSANEAIHFRENKPGHQ